MGKPTVCHGAVPVLDIRGDIDHISRMERLGFLTPFLIPVLSGDADKNLSAALVRMVDMPAIAASRLKRHIEDANLLGRERLKVAFALLISSRISCRSNSTASVT